MFIKEQTADILLQTKGEQRVAALGVRESNEIAWIPSQILSEMAEMADLCTFVYSDRLLTQEKSVDVRKYI